MRITTLIPVIGILICVAGCSGNRNPAAPDLCSTEVPQGRQVSNRSVIGLWDVKIDPAEQLAEIIPNRDAAMHFNALKLLEVSPCDHCLTVTNPVMISDEIIQLDVGIEHPYPGHPGLSGFDVRAILMTNSDLKFPCSNRRVSYLGTEPMLLSPDGYTALFNPHDYFNQPGVEDDLLTYQPGKFMTFDYPFANLNSFTAYGIDNQRRIFEAGSLEYRTIQIQFPDIPLEFSYAVDISWIPVDGVVDPINDFPPEANCLEPYKLVFDVDEITNASGSTALISVDVSDHQGQATISTVLVECPELFSGEIQLDYSAQTDSDTWEYTGYLINEFSTIPGTYPLLITASSIADDPNLGATPAYMVGEVDVVCSTPDNDNFLWVKTGYGYGTDGGHQIVSLSDESTVIAGTFHDPVTFGEGEANEVTLHLGTPHLNHFIVKYGSDGSFEWAKPILTPSISLQGLEVLSDNSMIMSGVLYKPATFALGEPGEITLDVEGNSDIFLARYSPDGSLIWARKDGGPEKQVCFGVNVLVDDSIVISGEYNLSAILGDGDPTETELTVEDSDYSEMFIARYSPDSELIWAKTDGGGTCYTGYDIAALSDGSFVVTGLFWDTVTFDEGGPNETSLSAYVDSPDFYLARYTSDGQFLWANGEGGANQEIPHETVALSDDSVIITGQFFPETIFGLGDPNETILTAAGTSQYDIFIAKFTSDGSFVWAKRAGGTGYDRCNGITALPDNSFMITGHYCKSAVFGEGENNETTLYHYGDADSADSFVAGYLADGSLITAVRQAALNTIQMFDITSLADGSYYITGNFSGELVFGQCGENETVLDTDMGYDIFIAKYGPLY